LETTKSDIVVPVVRIVVVAPGAAEVVLIIVVPRAAPQHPSSQSAPFLI